MAYPKYTYEVYNRAGTQIADISQLVTSRKIRAGRNKAEDISFSMDADALAEYADSINTTAAQLLSVGVNEVRIRRGRNYLVGGYISYYNASVDRTDRTLEVKVSGFLNFFKDRYFEVQRSFPGVDAAQILWTVIDENQSGAATFWDTSVAVNTAYADFGITEGTLDTIANKDRTYEAGKNVKDAIVQMTEVSTATGDFEFSPEKVFSFYDRLGSDKPQLIFTYPHNIVGGDFPMDAQQIANRVMTVGSGAGDTRVQAIDQDTSSQANYYIRQQFQQFNSVEETGTLSEHGMGYVQAAKDPLNVPEIEVDLNGSITASDFWVGDRITIRQEDTAIPSLVDGLYRVEEIDLNIDDNDGETARLSLSI